MAEVLMPLGTLKGHTDEVTAIQTSMYDHSMLISSSRDKSVMMWVLHPDPTVLSCWPGGLFGRAFRRLTGHSHFVSDVSLSSDGRYALSASWDRDLRLWDLSAGASTKRFVGHTNDALCVAFSPENRQIVSGSRDKSLRIWNTLGECKYAFEAHTEWVSSVQFSPVNHFIVSGSWDWTVRLWDASQGMNVAVLGRHQGYVSTVAVSPDGSLCASGGRDGVVILWDLVDGKSLYEMNTGSIIHALSFCPARYWLCAATEQSVMIWDLENRRLLQELFPGAHELTPPPAHDHQASCMGDDSKKKKKMTEEQLEVQKFLPPPPLPPMKKNQRLYCTSMSWSGDGSILFTGYTDGVIRVWGPNLGCCY